MFQRIVERMTKELTDTVHYSSRWRRGTWSGEDFLKIKIKIKIKEKEFITVGVGVPAPLHEKRVITRVR